MPLSESPDRHEDEETPAQKPDLPPKAMAMLAAMEDAAAELACAIRQDGTGSAEEAFVILSYAVAVARGEDTYPDAAGTEWPVGVTPSEEPTSPSLVSASQNALSLLEREKDIRPEADAELIKVADELRRALSAPARAQERGGLLSVSRDDAAEFWTVEHEHATVTITTDSSGRIIDAAEWRDGKAVQIDADAARPLLEAAVAHNERDTEPSDDPGELKEHEDFAQDHVPEPPDDND